MARSRKVRTPPPPGKLVKQKRSRLTEFGRAKLSAAAATKHGTRAPTVPLSRRFDMRGMVALFGGRSTLLWKLRDHGYISQDPDDPMPDVFSKHLTLRGIDAWISRGSLSADWLQVLMELHLKTEKFPLPLDEFRLAPLSAIQDPEVIAARRKREAFTREYEKKNPGKPMPDYGKPHKKRGPKPKQKSTTAATTKKKSG